MVDRSRSDLRTLMLVLRRHWYLHMLGTYVLNKDNLSVCPEDRKGVLGGVGDARCPESLVAGTGQQETGSKVIRREPENRRQMRMPFSEPVTVVPPGLQGGLQL
ncbi:hypothetical protein HZH68_013889 [Vespula germanica]|uniref:Uncharacterized protein n=2 Tax=Vespula TaxID=7451 RepID=A0A834MVR7_VESGE|nr:hypothetical protein HZH66_012537 [Vespula vulgaris]KAF7385459.1 hypothetical protein HZH68_013889 [Vespula germanica]